jgi:hypothetical protein
VRFALLATLLAAGPVGVANAQGMARDTAERSFRE